MRAARETSRRSRRARRPPPIRATSRISDARAALAASQREVLELAYFEGLSCTEIAARCGAPLGTVKSRLSAGVRELRRLFDRGAGSE
ncbi:MAG TPA: sigma factor-like helix-turn-helix DNA-binding protein [Myxococcota bacterium]|nr:sigma factor-like helix-turn-helix DNA-binding protein [Myxococcota bacterium]